MMALEEVAESKAAFTLVRESGCSMGFFKIDMAILFPVDILPDALQSCIWPYDAALAEPRLCWLPCHAIFPMRVAG